MKRTFLLIAIVRGRKNDDDRAHRRRQYACARLRSPAITRVRETILSMSLKEYPNLSEAIRALLQARCFETREAPRLAFPAQERIGPVRAHHTCGAVIVDTE